MIAATLLHDGRRERMQPRIARQRFEPDGEPAPPVGLLADRAGQVGLFDFADHVGKIEQEQSRGRAGEEAHDRCHQVKGEDYRGREISGAQFAGETVLLPLEKDCSTTRLLQAMGAE